MGPQDTKIRRGPPKTMQGEGEIRRGNERAARCGGVKVVVPRYAVKNVEYAFWETERNMFPVIRREKKNRGARKGSPVLCRIEHKAVNRSWHG